MSAKSRKNSICVVYEGYQEGYFLEYLAEHSNVRLNHYFCNGGSANQIVIDGIKRSAQDITVLAFFDEDFESKPQYKISDESLEGLARVWKLSKDELKKYPYKGLQALNTEMRNPILVVSCPQSIEGFLLRLLDIPFDDLKDKTTQQLKNRLASILDTISLNNDDEEKMQDYERKISRYRDEIAKQKQNESNFRERRRFLESKIADCGRSKNKVIFMRFLSEKLSLPIILAKRAEILELDILLTAFGL